MHQPSSRSGIGPGGVHAGSTNVSSVDALSRGDRRAEHPGERHCDAEHEHRRDREPRDRRHQRAQRDQDRADDAQAGVGDGAAGPITGESRIGFTNPIRIGSWRCVPA